MKTKTQHTPGPWEVAIRKDGLGQGPNRHSLEIVHNYPDGGGQQVIVGKHTGIDCLTKENAAYIVRACNSHTAMLEALKAVRDNIIGCDVLFDPSPQWEVEQERYNAAIEALDLVKRAIAQAEGRTV